MLLRASARADVAPERVWEALLDWEGAREWMTPPTVVEVVGEQRTGIGARLHAVSTIAGVLRLDDTFVVTDWVEGREIRVRHVGWMIRGDGIFRVSPDGTFTWIEDVPLPLGVVGEVIGLLLRPLAHRAMRRSCENLVRRLSP